VQRSSRSTTRPDPTAKGVFLESPDLGERSLLVEYPQVKGGVPTAGQRPFRGVRDSLASRAAQGGESNGRWPRRTRERYGSSVIQNFRSCTDGSLACRGNVVRPH
jgi:hypothetical protein